MGHSGYAESGFPTVAKGGLVTQVVINGVKPEVQAGLVGALFELLPPVLLPAQDEFEVALPQMEGVVRHNFIVAHLLERKDRRIAEGVSLPFNHTGRQMEVAESETGVSPGTVAAQHAGSGTLTVAGIGHGAVQSVLIGVGIFVREAATHKPAFDVPVGCQGIGQQAVIGLIFRRNASAKLSGAPDGFRMENEDAGQGIGAIHQGGRTFEDLHRMDTGAIYLYTVLVSPLLAFLPYTVIDHDYTVIAHSADNGLGDAAAGGDFTKTGFGGNGIDDVAAGAGRKIGRTDHRDRCGHFFHLAVSGKAGDNYFIKLQVLVEYICRIRNSFLSGRCHTYRKQRQCKYAPLQRHNKEYTKKCAKIILIMGIPEIIPY